VRRENLRERKLERGEQTLPEVLSPPLAACGQEDSRPPFLPPFPCARPAARGRGDRPPFPLPARTTRRGQPPCCGQRLSLPLSLLLTAETRAEVSSLPAPVLRPGQPQADSPFLPFLLARPDKARASIVLAAMGAEISPSPALCAWIPGRALLGSSVSVVSFFFIVVVILNSNLKFVLDEDEDVDECVGLCLIRGITCARIRAMDVVSCSRSCSEW
jgi:hypothetical protein